MSGAGWNLDTATNSTADSGRPDLAAACRMRSRIISKRRGMGSMVVSFVWLAAVSWSTLPETCRMQIQSLKIFCDLVGSGSFSRAAELNGITQSAVSQQVRALEEKYQVQLLERSRRQVIPTPEGRAFLQTSREILGSLESLEQRLERLRQQVAGRLRLCSVLSIGLHELPGCLRQFREYFPEVEVEVHYRRSAQVYAAVQDGSADLGLVAYPVPRRGLDFQTWWKDRLVLVCPPGHALAARHSVRFADLHGERFIAFESDLPTRKFLDRRFKESKVKIKNVMELDNIETLKRTVENENAISILPETSVKAEVRSGALRTVPIRAPDLWRPLGVLIKKSAAPSPARREFLRILRHFDLGAERSNLKA